MSHCLRPFSVWCKTHLYNGVGFSSPWELRPAAASYFTVQDQWFPKGYRLPVTVDIYLYNIFHIITCYSLYHFFMQCRLRHLQSLIIITQERDKIYVARLFRPNGYTLKASVRWTFFINNHMQQLKPLINTLRWLGYDFSTVNKVNKLAKYVKNGNIIR